MVLVTYDLKTDHIRLKKELKALGWKETIQGDRGGTVYLPNTTLWKEGNDATTASNEVQRVLKAPNLERLMVVVFQSWSALHGTPFNT